MPPRSNHARAALSFGGITVMKRRLIWSSPSQTVLSLLCITGVLTLGGRSFAAPPQNSPQRMPQIDSVSVYGLQSGGQTSLVIRGSDLLPEPKLLGIPGAQVELRSGSSPLQIEFAIKVPASTGIGHYPMRIQTSGGISHAVPIAVDGLPQIPESAEAGKDAQHPLALPVAISGRLSGPGRAQVFVKGRAGERIVIDVECRRLGGTLSPVLEFKNSKRTPLAIQWSQAELQGDTRIVSRFPEDGIYLIELHDLAFQASGSSPYRLKMGDLKLADAVFPAVLPAGTRRETKLIGPGWENAAPLTADTLDLLPGMSRSVLIAQVPGAVAPAPSITAGDAIEILERSSDLIPQEIDASFVAEPRMPVALNGQISKPGEVDRYRLKVHPSSSLKLKIDSRPLHSRLDAQLTVSRPNQEILAQSEERSELEWVVPPGINSVLVSIRDLHGQGGQNFPYRLEIRPANRPGFTLSLRDDRIAVPKDGRGIVRLEVNRQGYEGAILLRPQGVANVDIIPKEIPAGVAGAWVQVSPHPGTTVADVQNLRIVGESTGATPLIRTTAQIQNDLRLSFAGNGTYEIPVASLPPAGFDVEPQSLPKHFYRGIPLELPITVSQRSVPAEAKALKLTLLTTEIPKPRSLNPIRGFFGRTKSLDDPAIPLRTKTENTDVPLTRALLRVKVPDEGPDGEMDCVIRADLLSDTLAARPLATAYSRAFRRQIPIAASIKYDANAVILRSGGPAKFTGKVARHPDYHETVEVFLKGLPKDYLAPHVTVPPDQESFEIIVTSPKVTAGGEILNVNFVIQDQKGHNLQPELLLPARIEVQK